MIPPDDLAACRAAIRQGSRSFHAASLMLPARVRDPALALYAFCRLADDAADLAGDGDAALERMRRPCRTLRAGRRRDATRRRHAPTQARPLKATGADPP